MSPALIWILSILGYILVTRFIARPLAEYSWAFWDSRNSPTFLSWMTYPMTHFFWWTQGSKEPNTPFQEHPAVKVFVGFAALPLARTMLCDKEGEKEARRQKYIAVASLLWPVRLSLKLICYIFTLWLSAFFVLEFLISHRVTKKLIGIKVK